MSLGLKNLVVRILIEISLTKKIANFSKIATWESKKKTSRKNKYNKILSWKNCFLFSIKFYY